SGDLRKRRARGRVGAHGVELKDAVARGGTKNLFKRGDVAGFIDDSARPAPSLAGRISDNDRHRRMAFCLDDLDWLLGKDMSVHVRPVDAWKHAEGTGNPFYDFSRTLATQASRDIRSSIAADGLGHALTSIILVLLERLDLAAGGDTALHGDAVDKSARQRRRYQRTRIAPTCRGPKEEDVGRVATESRDVALDPLQHRYLIEAAVVAVDLLR